MITLEGLVSFVLNEKVEFSRGVLNKSDTLLKVRLWVYAFAFLHLVVIALRLLTIDFNAADDPAVWVYSEFKWKLITCWFNLVAMLYFPMSMYCDWRELRGESEWKHVKDLNRIRFTLFTSIIFPTTVFADILFWRLWNKDRELVAPRAVDSVVPFWTQHSMHTVTLVVTVVDLMLVPRKRPENCIPGLTLTMLFVTAYTCVCGYSYSKGEYLYPVFKQIRGIKLPVLYAYVVVEHLFYYFGQFLVNDLIWGRQNPKNPHLHTS